MPRSFRRPAALLALLLALAACDTADGDESTFTATLTGALDAQLEGEASFGPIVEAGEPRFRILLQADRRRSGGTRGSIGFYFDGEGRPDGGTYTVGSTDGVEALIVLVDDQGAPSLTGRSGTLTLTESSPARMSGTFSFEAGTPFGGGDTAVTGTFTARAE